MAQEEHPGREPQEAGTGSQTWDEHDWERFMRRADVRTARYQELYETLRHHPQRDALIAKDMGWEALWAECQARRRDCDRCPQQAHCEPYALRRIGRTLEGKAEESDQAVADFGQVKTIPAYVEAHEFCVRLHTYFTRHLGDAAYGDEDVLHAISSAHLVPAKIAGGHGIGYDRDSLGGNIANCKRALKKADTCLEALHDIISRHLIPEGDGIALLAEADAVRHDVACWISHLRSLIPGHPPQKPG